MDLEQAKKKLIKLSQYKNNPEKLDKAALKLTKLGDEDLDVSAMFIDKEEAKIAKEFLRKYLDEFFIENISDKNTLKQLIYLEVLQLTLQKNINNCQEKNGMIPPQLIESFHKNTREICYLKDLLRINNRKQEEIENNDNKSELDLLKKKIKIWSENNPSRHKACPYCGRMILWKIRPEVWDAQKHPFFPKDRVIGNIHLIKLYKENKITKEDVANILEVSPDYISWLLEKWNTIKE